jgi:hypothetical protein
LFHTRLLFIKDKEQTYAKQGLSKLLSYLRRERQNSNLTVFKFACESKVNVKVNIKKVILPIQKMLYASLGCYILLRTYVST